MMAISTFAGHWANTQSKTEDCMKNALQRRQTLRLSWLVVQTGQYVGICACAEVMGYSQAQFRQYQSCLQLTYLLNHHSKMRKTIKHKRLTAEKSIEEEMELELE